MKNSAIIFVAMLLTGAAYCADILVPDDQQTIQGAINAANNGDRVIVSRGEYVENITFSGKRITVAGEFIETGDWEDVKQTIINGQNGNAANAEGSCVRFNSQETQDSKLIGFTLINGKGINKQGLECEYSGGGIGIITSSATIEDCIIRNNGDNGTLFGGGIYIKGDAVGTGCTVTINRCWIYGNSAATSGGGVWCSTRSKGEAQAVNTVTFNDCFIAGNKGNNGGAGGVGAYGYTELKLNRCVIASNACGGAGRGTNTENFGNAHLSLWSCIVWGWDGNRPMMKDNSAPGPLSGKYSCIQGDKQYVSASDADWVAWDGIVAGDPKWADPNNMDYHLTWANFPQDDNTKSSCIDTGDPDANKDPDATRADIGPYFFMQGHAVIYGLVLNAENDDPIIGAKVTTNIGGKAETDNDGYFRILSGPGDFEITATADGFLDSTAAANVELDDSVEVNFGMLYPDFELTIDKIADSLDADHQKGHQFAAENNGTGPVNYSVAKMGAGGVDVKPWDKLTDFLVGPALQDQGLQGVVWVQDMFVVAGGGNQQNQIYLLDADGNEISRFNQFGQSNNGIYDMTYDGELVWGVEDQQIYGFTVDGDLITTIDAEYKPLRGITWDPDREVLWVVGRTAATNILGYSVDGQKQFDLGAVKVAPVALSYFPDDPDGMPLYITTLSDNSEMMIYKMNPDDPDTQFVALVKGSGKQEGGEIINNYSPGGVWTYIGMADNLRDDKIEVRLVQQNMSWFSLDPMDPGVIKPGEDQQFDATVDATGLQEGDYEGSFVFTHNAEGGSATIPVTLTVKAGGPPPKPQDIKLTPADTLKLYAAPGDRDSTSVVIENVGELPLKVQSQTIQPAFSPFTLGEGNDQAIVINPGESHKTWVFYEPPFEIESNATLKIISDDPDEQVVNLQLDGIPHPIDTMAVNTGIEMPREFSITSVYPSPFNASATVRFGLTRPGVTTVNLIDIQGRVVGTLERGMLNAGYHSYVIHGMNLASGVYWVRVTGEEGVRTQKVVLLK